MKKIILLLFLFIFGCDKIPTGVEDPKVISFQANVVRAPESVIYSKSDSLFVTNVKFSADKAAEISEVWVDLYDSDNSKLNSSPIYMYDDGNLQSNGDSVKNDLVYSARVPMSINYSNGQYILQYYVKDFNNTIHNIAVHNFAYKSIVVDTPPVISNLNAADTLNTSQQNTFFLSIKADDKDGLNDIKEVYFELFRPDGSQTSIPKNDMFDDGNVQKDGDQQAGDGIFSYIGQLPSTIAKGNWKFVFHATDKSDSLSNTITKYIYIK